MKKFKKIMVGLTSAAVLAVNMTSFGANAVEHSDRHRTSAMTAGEWYKTPTISMASSSNTISSGDFGTWWFTGGVGLDTRFVRSNSRCVNIQLYEADAGGTDIHTKNQKAYFKVNNSGLYGAYSFTGETIVNNAVVETDGIAEVYMKLKVDTISGDTTRNIPSGLMVYEYWIE